MSQDKPNQDAESNPPDLNATIVSSTASHQHLQEQEMLSTFTIPEPPVSTKQSTLAAETHVDDREETHPEPPRTLWMGDLDPWLDEAAIVDLWLKVLGVNVSVKLIKPKNFKQDSTYPGLTHSGYCFVEFPSYESAQRALALNGQLLPDIAMPSQHDFRDNPDNQKKYFRLNWASGATLSAPIVETPEYSLFVGDLSASTTEAHLLSFFQKSYPNSIRTVRVMTDPISGKSRCFGFVRFTDEQDREKALVEMNGAWFGGRPLKVALATPRSGGPSRRPMPGQGIPTNSLGNNGQNPNFMFMPPPGPPQMPAYYPPVMNENTPDMGMPPMSYGMNMNPQYPDQLNTTVFVGGLSSEVDESTLFTLFKPYGNIESIKIPPGKNCGFLRFTTHEEAEEAIRAMAGFIIGGHRVRLGWGRVSVNNKRFRRTMMAQMQMQAAMSMGMDPAGYPQGANFPGVPPRSPPMGGPGFGPVPMGMPPPNMMAYLSGQGPEDVSNRDYLSPPHGRYDNGMGEDAADDAEDDPDKLAARFGNVSLGSSGSHPPPNMFFPPGMYPGGEMPYGFDYGHMAPPPNNYPMGAVTPTKLEDEETQEATKTPDEEEKTATLIYELSFIETNYNKNQKQEETVNPHILRSFTSQSSGQSDVLLSDGDSLGVDSTQVGVLEQGDQVGFNGFLQSTNSGGSESQVGLEVLGNFSDQSLERQLSDQKLSRLLESSDFSQGHGTWLISVGLLDTARDWGRLSGGLGGQSLSWSLTTGGFSGCLLSSGHFGGFRELQLKKERSKKNEQSY